MPSPIPIEIRHHRHSTDVKASLPGVRLRDLRVSITRDELRIEARCGDDLMVASVPLAPPIDERRATIHFNGGDLTLHLPVLPA
jgi:HSP20 family molecular chaperone IbpA